MAAEMRRTRGIAVVGDDGAGGGGSTLRVAGAVTLLAVVAVAVATGNGPFGAAIAFGAGILWPRRSRRAVAAGHPGESDVEEVLGEELDRARRFGHPFSVARLVPDGQAEAPSPGDLADAVRSVDLVCADPVATYVLLPETDRAGAERFLDRLGRDAPALVRRERTRVVSFPEDELTGAALLDRLARTSVDPGEGRERDAS
jgi:hypothetical protein